MNSVTLTNTALERIREIQQKAENHEKFLRVSISGGGCSGFQYIFELDEKRAEGDIKIAEENSKILAITDETSLPFLANAEIDFVKELGASYFKVNNPNAKANCGCGSSFSV
ncbi:MAG: iron-sulfur cluster assembly accessory protein [Rickettsiales bacterium]|nr:iron-sulfur cluster assembly accessory protein [Rickettsiales bacterium]